MSTVSLLPPQDFNHLETSVLTRFKTQGKASLGNQYNQAFFKQKFSDYLAADPEGLHNQIDTFTKNTGIALGDDNQAIEVVSDMASKTVGLNLDRLDYPDGKDFTVRVKEFYRDLGVSDTLLSNDQKFWDIFIKLGADPATRMADSWKRAITMLHTVFNTNSVKEMFEGGLLVLGRKHKLMEES